MQRECRAAPTCQIPSLAERRRALRPASHLSFIASGYSMRARPLHAALSLVLASGFAHASGTFTALQTPNLTLGKVSANGEYAVGTTFGGEGFRWTSSTATEEVLPGLDTALGVNDAGAVSGAVPENGGVNNGGRDLGAFQPVGADPVQLTSPLQTNSNGYDVSDDGTVVGLSFGDNFVGPAVAFVWTEAEGMTARPVNRPDNYSRANVISADGRVIAGWNDQDDGFRTAVVWKDRVPTDLVDRHGIPVGEADGISADGDYVVGSSYTDIDGNAGAWRWNSHSNTMTLIPLMTFAFGVTANGDTVVGNTGFFDDPPRAAVIWRKTAGSMLLADYLAEQGIAVPDGWDLSGGLTGISADGRTLVGWGSGPLGAQSYVIRIDAPDALFADGFDAR
jgi:uncharacterized membrane protein